MGQPLYYPTYKSIISENRNLNIVFTVDASGENEQNIAVAKSTLQDISLKLKKINYFQKVNFGVVLYKNNNVYQDALTDENGRFDFSPIDPGFYDLEVSYIGFQTKRINKSFHPTWPRNFPWTPAPWRWP